MAPSTADPAAGAPPVSKRWYRQLWAIKDTIIIVLTPLLLLPILFIFPDHGKLRPASCAYTILIMIIYWMTEVLPMAVTALIPVVLFPWLGVMDSKLVCQNYLKDANMLFFGGLLVAVAVEKWNLHKRVALRVLLLVGSEPLWIMFGFMAVTAFLSMWLNNTATTAMMMPIAHAVLTELDVNRKRELEEVVVGDHDHATELVPLTSSQGGGARGSDVHPDDIQFKKNGSPDVPPPSYKQVSGEHAKSANHEPARRSSSLKASSGESDRKFMAFRKALKLSIPYSSSIGGTGTLIGSGPNIVFKGQLESLYIGDTGINFTSWLVIGFPAMVIDMVGAWLILMLIFLGPRDTFNCCKRAGSQGKKSDSANHVIRAEYEKLGQITFAEVVVLVNFIILSLLWFFREPEFIPGWASLFPHKYITDACLAITISLLLFILPSRLPNYLCFRRSQSGQTEPKPASPILDWPTVNKQMPWNVILLLGGGFALADACKQSGLSGVIGTQLGHFRTLPDSLIVALMVLMATIMTSFTSNMATTTIFIPIMAELAHSTEINPLYLMLPVTLAASWAYILPVSTPPNAIAYSYGDLVIMDMIKAGLAMCALCITVLLLSINTWGYYFFNLGVYPDWAPRHGNFSLAGGPTNETFASTPTVLNLTTLF